MLAQVRKKGGDLRRETRFCALWWRRSNPKNPTCARTAIDLRQNGHRPAPGKVLTCAVMAIDLRQELRSTELCPLSFRPSGSEWRNLRERAIVGEIPGQAGNDGGGIGGNDRGGDWMRAGGGKQISRLRLRLRSK